MFTPLTVVGDVKIGLDGFNIWINVYIIKLYFRVLKKVIHLIH